MNPKPAGLAGPVDSPERLRAKEIHRKVMVVIGLFTAACGLAGGYLVLSPGGDLPGFMYGRARARAPQARVSRRPKAALTAWGRWSPSALADAQSKDRLILLNLESPWSSSCRRMEETTYADAEVAAWVKMNVVAIRVDGEERPDLVRRYLSGGWPTTALLIPGGEILAAGTFLNQEQFLPWAKTVAESFAKKRPDVASAAVATAKRRSSDWAARGKTAQVGSASDVLHLTRKELEAQWDPETGGFGSGARFPRFRRIRFLHELGQAEPWAATMAARAWEGARSLEDPVWGGFYRYAAGPGWERPEREKLLADQADALSAAWPLDKEAAARTLKYAREVLSDPAGGFAASQSCEVLRPDGTIIEGPYYFALSAKRRKALGVPPVDRRLFAAANGRMIRAMLEGSSTPEEAGFALKSLERFWKEGVRGGVVLHRLGGELSGLLEDQLSLSEAFLAAYARFHDREALARAQALLRAAESNLLDRASGAFFDRPSLGELPEGLDRVLWPDLNAAGARLYLGLAKALPESDAERSRLLSRAAGLMNWLSAHHRDLGPAEWAWLVKEQSVLHGLASEPGPRRRRG